MTHFLFANHIAPAGITDNAADNEKKMSVYFLKVGGEVFVRCTQVNGPKNIRMSLACKHG